MVLTKLSPTQQKQTIN